MNKIKSKEAEEILKKIADGIVEEILKTLAEDVRATIRPFIKRGSNKSLEFGDTDEETSHKIKNILSRLPHVAIKEVSINGDVTTIVPGNLYTGMALRFGFHQDRMWINGTEVPICDIIGKDEIKVGNITYGYKEDIGFYCRPDKTCDRINVRIYVDDEENNNGK